MKTILLKGHVREDAGTASANQLRDNGMVPCVLYGSGAHVIFSVYSDDFKNLVYTPNTYLVKLDIDGTEYKAVMQDLQFHPVNDSILHVDFLAIDESKPVTLAVPTLVKGNSPGVRSGGRLAIKLKKVRVKAMLNDLPDSVEVDISGLELGKSIKVENVSIPNVELLEASNVAIVTVEATRATRQAANDAAAAGK
ncbi:MAG: 50S ribosomal protein L25/general stress protein Ctc [Bacteroidetes bacterium]|nr:MAG: 50S ribosomal protein L25/general stress protein Ctc [Bacteroidota bacterium]